MAEESSALLRHGVEINGNGIASLNLARALSDRQIRTKLDKNNQNMVEERGTL